MNFRGFLMVLMLWVAFGNKVAWADHLNSGELTITALSTPNMYRISLRTFASMTFYVMGGNSYSGGTRPESTIAVHVFKKRDHQKVESFNLTRPQAQTSGVLALDASTPCNGIVGNLFTVRSYVNSLDVRLDPAKYNDPMGYYIIWERCCRVENLINIQDAGENVGMVGRVDFPAIIRNNQPFINSSPTFPRADAAQFACVNQPIQIDASATDTDGDERRYSIVAPLRGYTTEGSNNNVGSGESRSTYPEVRWAAGYSAANPLNSPQGLRINAATGQMTGQSDKVGSFVFAVLVEEYRNGEKIGEIRRDYQLVVRDCDINNPTPPAITVDGITGETTLCNNESKTLTAPLIANATYQWYKNGAIVPNATSRTLSVSQAGEYQVKVKTACSPEASSPIFKVNTVTTSPLTIAPSGTVEICSGDVTRLETNLTTTTHRWYLNNTLISGEQTNRLNASAPGVYRAEVGDALSNCLLKDSVVIALRVSPTALNLRASKSVICGEDSVLLSVNSIAGYTLEWRRDGQILPFTSFSFYAKVGGLYQVRASLGNCSQSDTLRIQSIQSPNVPLVTSSNGESGLQICRGETVSLATAMIPNTTYQWQLEGANIGSTNTSSIQVTKAGNYRVQIATQGVCNFTLTSEIFKVNEGQAPQISLGSSDTTRICNGDTALLQTSSPTQNEYRWYRNGALLTGVTGSELRTTQPGMYRVEARNATLVCSVKDSIAVVFNTPPSSPTITASKNIFCVGDSSQLRLNAPSGYNIEWRRDGQIIAETRPNFYTNQAGIYQVRIFAGNCSATSNDIALTAELPPVVTFGTIAPVCYNDTLVVNLTASPAGGQFGGQGVDGNRVRVSQVGVGSHAVTYTVISSNGCRGVQTQALEVRPTPEVTLPSQMVVGENDDTELTPTIEGASPFTYQWSPPQGLSSATIASPRVNISENTSYTLTVTAANGCIARASINVVLEVVDLIFIPDVFTPNKDGVNDTWEIKNIQIFPEAEVTIYNRWGEAIFHQTKGYQMPWDGTYGGGAVASGQYTYVINPHAKEFGIFRGKVLVLR
ncbi:gliding motility-associated C-terminal domain-containing protein [Runella zeae]|uniref:gliding motility-associated C-terminal domain-containing protein n=1 Tax=Runella zeae TaxID=94255 RepID=UPI0023530FA5|nr:gliding motility-associated C-terminal domain-containing protein [Runella zeae]